MDPHGPGPVCTGAVRFSSQESLAAYDTMDEIAVSVVIPAHNASATLAVQLDALTRQTAEFGWEVIVVDNGSTDETSAIARSYADRLVVRVVSCTQPGANAARNVGGSVARGSLLLYCDADDRVCPDWISAMACALRHHDAAGGAIDNDSLNVDLKRGPLYRYPARLNLAAGFLPAALGANLGVRKNVWAALGGFDPNYTYGSTDTEFCWRLQLAGHTLGYATDAVVAYRHRATLRSIAVKAYLTGRSRAHLFQDFRVHGMPRPRLTGAMSRWASLLVSIPLMPFSRRLQRWWVSSSAAAVGRIVGSVVFRVRYL
jgi:glycosyltransferase involved in cell wall biosynthesis